MTFPLTQEILQDGEVADPPVDATASNNIKYAHSIRRPPSPVFDTQDEALFCATCIKNQHFLTQALASYLPATTDSNYQVYEDSFPEYKKELEDRYPPICERCAPRASDRLKATSYAAKTDHVRRMMDRTRDASISRRDVWDWRGPMLALGAISWWSSSALFVLWHVAGATTGAPTYIRHSRSFTSVASRCFQIGSGSECVDFISPYVSLALVLAILSSWWNPCISEKLRIQRGRMVGLSEFYRLQFATVFVRVLAWLLLGRSSQMLPGDIEYIGLHAFLGGFNILVCPLSPFIKNKLTGPSDVYNLPSYNSDQLCSSSVLPRQPGASRSVEESPNLPRSCRKEASRNYADQVRSSVTIVTQ